MINKYIHAFLRLLLLVFVTTSVNSQVGSFAECNNCDGMVSRYMPVSGLWHNPEQSGSGFIFEFQDELLAGYYFGYDSEGSAKWMLFSGPLQESENDDLMWEIETDLITLGDGNAINEPYSPPVVADQSNSVRVEFLSLKYARVSFNGDEFQYYSPVIFGDRMTKEFEESDHLFPDAQGLWTFVYKRNYPEILAQQHNYFSELLYIDEPERETLEDGTKQVTYSVRKFDPFPPFEGLGLGSIVCENPVNSESAVREVICYMTGFPSAVFGNDYSGQTMVVPLGNFGAYQLTAEFINPEFEESGFSIEAKKVVRLEAR